MDIRIIKKNVSSLIIAAVLLLSPITLNFIKTSLSVSGSAKIYLIEILVFGLAVYVVLWKCLIKRELKKLSPLTRIVFYAGVLFGVYYLLSCSIRYLTNTLTFGSFFLARVIIESIVVFMALDYFKIDRKKIYIGFIMAFILVTIWQYGILFFGAGFLRGNDPVLTISYVYVVFCNIIHILLAYLYSETTSRPVKNAILVLFFFNLPTVYLTGSRVGICVTAFLLTIFCLFVMKERTVWSRIKNCLLVYLLIMVTFLFSLLISSNENKGIVVRSISIPLEVVKAITPSSTDKAIDELLTFKVDESKFEDIKTNDDYKNSKNYVDNTNEVSGLQRHEANSKAYEQIFSSPTRFFFGTGTGMIHRYGNKYQKPHNYFAQYALAFGVVGFILSLIFFFSPAVYIFAKKRSLFMTIILFQFPIMFNAFLQPAMGSIVILFLFMTINYCLSLAPDSKSES